MKNKEISKKPGPLGILTLIALCMISFNVSDLYSMDAIKKAIQDNKGISASTASAALVGYSYHTYAQSMKPLTFDWPKLQPTIAQPQTFPKGFLFGSGTSAHQVEGDCTNNTWSLWEKSVDEQGKKRVESPSGKACDHWKLYKEDIKLMKNIGLNAYRFSVEWSKIEPKEGQFDESALTHYEDVCKVLRANNIQPCITLHHYTDPIWFLNKSGFEKDENIDNYVQYANTMIKRLGKYDPMFYTFNSPDGYAAQGYITCTKPAGRLVPTKDLQLHGQVYRNLLKAHVATYRMAKNNPDTASAQIGILKNIFQLDPYNAYNPLDLLACFMGKKLVDNCFFDFFTSGKFNIHVPFKVNVNHFDKDAVGALDFIGINYYGHGCMKNFQVTAHQEEETTDNERYTIYAEGLYRAIEQMSHKLARPLNVPMYITENGIATTDDAKRDLFLKRYLYSLHKAIAAGHDVRGYMYWSFMDNYEWGCYTKKYGIYAVNFQTQERTLRPGSQFYIDTIKHNTDAK